MDIQKGAEELLRSTFHFWRSGAVLADSSRYREGAPIEPGPEQVCKALRRKQGKASAKLPTTYQPLYDLVLYPTFLLF